MISVFVADILHFDKAFLSVLAWSRVDWGEVRYHRYTCPYACELRRYQIGRPEAQRSLARRRLALP